MPSTKRIRSGARALRRALDRAHRRAEPLPRLPFVVAFAMALMTLLVALEFRPPSEEDVAEVEERPSYHDGYGYEDGFSTEEVEFEIVEYGVSRVVVQDLPRIIVALVVRNPYDKTMSPGAVSLTAETDEGQPIRIEDFYLGMIPPQTTMGVAFVASAGSVLPAETLRLENSEPSYLYEPPPEGEEDVFNPPSVVPEATLLETEPLLSPDGYRLRYRLDSPEAVDVQVSILFRDGEGRLLGGVPAAPEPFDRFHGGWVSNRFAAGEGETLRHVDVLREWMPEGADPDRFEIGPSV